MKDDRLRWRTLIPRLPARLWLLATAAFVNFLGYMVVPFLALYLTQVTGFSVEVTGVLLTCFGAGNILGAWSGGKLSDRIGPTRVMIFSFVVSAFAMSIVPMLSGALPVAIALIVLAFANGAFRPAYDSGVVRWCPENERPRAYAVYVVAINIGAGIAAASGGFLYTIEPSLIFYANTLTSLLSAVLVFFLVTPPTTYLRSERSCKLPEQALPAAPYKNISFLIVCLAACVLDIVARQTSSTLPLYVSTAYGMAPQDFGTLLTIGYITFAIAVMPVSSWVKLQNQLRIAVAGMCIVAASFSMLPFGSESIILVGIYLLMTLGQLLFYPAIMAIVMGESAKNELKSGEYMGFYRTMQSVAGIAAPSIGTFVYAWTSPAILWILCALLTLWAAAALLGQRSVLQSERNLSPEIGPLPADRAATETEPLGSPAPETRKL